MVALLVFLSGLGALNALTPQTPSEWQAINIGDLFSFRLPQGFAKRAADEARGEYYKGETKIIFVWGHTESGAYANRRQSWMNDYQETTTRLRGKRANIRTYSTTKGKRIYHAELNVGNWDKGQVQLYMRIEGADPDTLDLANQIFKSVTFPIPPPESIPVHLRSSVAGSLLPSSRYFFSHA